MNNVEIAELLNAVASAYKLKDDKKNRFKIMAYERAADAVEHMSSEAKDLYEDGKLEDVAGIGKSIAGYLGEIFTIGKCEHFDDLLKGLPPAMFELTKVSGIGTKSAYRLTNEFGSRIGKKNPLADLKKLAEAGEIEKLEGFGKDSQEAIIKSIDEVSGRETRLLISYAEEIANEIINWMKECETVVEVDALGSLRRKASTVGDIDLAVASNNTNETLDHFVNYPKATRVLEKGDRSASIVVPGNRQVDLMVESEDAYGALLQHFTGSKHHNIALRKFALKKGVSLSDYGAKKLQDKKQELTKFATEKELYNFLGMDYIPPELREGKGEIEAALKINGTSLPNLITLEDIKGDFHMHSSFDVETSHDLGLSTMEEMISIGDSLNYEYMAFTEHNPSKSGHNISQIVDILKRKKEKVDDLNLKLTKNNSGVKKIFNSLEIDMLKEGGVSVPDEALEILDFALVSIHSSFRLSKDAMTKRIIKSLSHPKIKIFAHPTGRKLNEREGVEIDWDKVFDYALKNKKWIEINSSVSRLDLPDHLVKEAVSLGVKLTLGTDSHHKDHMMGMPYGVFVARRGWAEKKDIINSRSLKDIEIMLE